MTQCVETMRTRVIKGVIQPITSFRNKLNPWGITYKYGKKAGKLRKIKTLKEDMLNEK